MKHLLFIGFIFSLFLGGCSQTQLVAHTVKKIPMPGDLHTSKGRYKVGSPYKIKGKWYTPKAQYDFVQTGVASWYGPMFHGKQTANGEIFNKFELTAAHKTLQMPSLVRVINLENGRALIVRVNDRGPYSRGRIIDLSEKSAELLGFKNQGTAKVKIEVLGPESKAIAEAARKGIDTRGVEIAMNRTGQLPSRFGGIAPVTQQKTQLAKAQHPPIAKGKPSAIYVQAGAFEYPSNARTAQTKLARLNYRSKIVPVDVNQKRLYRLKVGPIASVDSADKILKGVIDQGFESAMIVLD